ncbi:hypothetical protein DCAR_0207843 [Daucus carota subsp. sativus]|uniref:Uncharacterized protein n=1 Tax=Daucus carota subsp. sativus TaxID=79200 RepID=A0A166E571_DAUCS|nr:PREDICTED: uncharacterized protein LOC108209731 [Daucus carota subsp. sativus]WOG88608.1 hypothetical protein DCAR_0207843 [Daucus carota subsp. sativus]
MSFEFENQSLQENVSEARDGSQKVNKVSYTREFLLSLSQLEICKNLPTGFDRSILGEFEDTTQQRVSGPGPLLGSRRGDYGSSPPTRGESNHPRGIYGKWGSRSSGQSDKDSDSQSDRESESSRLQGNPSRRPWQSADHDGLLGSGSFPRPSGYAAGMIASKVQGNDHFQLKKSNEPYHPPRPYKAVPHTRREISDSINDETFGSADCTSEDRAEEERKRRASFELMRKEQQKVLQEKQKMHVDKQKDDFFTADAASLEQTTVGRALKQDSESDGSGSQLLSNTGSGNNPVSSHTSAPRPLVPPGFASTISEKISGPKFTLSTQETSKQEIEENILLAKAKHVQKGIPGKQEEILSIHELVINEKQPKDDNVEALFATKADPMVNPLSGLEVTNHVHGNTSILKTGKVLNDGKMVHSNTKKLIMNTTASDSNEDKSRSILDKLFGSSLTVNTSANLKELNDGKSDVKQSPNMAGSSKFSHWFSEEENKPPENHTSVGPDNLLSLIAGGGKAGVPASDVESTQVIPPELIQKSSEFGNRLPYNSMSSATTGIFEQSCNYKNTDTIPAVLTCEDLEGKILSEYSERSSILQPPVYVNSAIDTPEMQAKPSVDNHASVHILSLLQKGANLKDLTPSPVAEIGLSGQLLNSEVHNTVTEIDKSRAADAEPLQDTRKNNTLEALFGTAFMKELQSVEAPVSVHRSLAGAVKSDYIEPHGLSFHVGNDGSGPANEIESNRSNVENRRLTPNPDKTMPVEIESWLGYTDPQINLESLKMQNEGRAKHGLHGVRQSQLPEEQNLLVGDPLNPSKSRYIPDGGMKISEVLSSTSSDIAKKLAALNAGHRDERSLRAQEGPNFNRGPNDQYQNLYAKASPPQFHSPQMNYGRPLFNPTDYHSAHMSSQMKYMAPESINHDGRINNHFPVNMIRPPVHHHNTAPTEFDLPVHLQMLQQMQVPQNFPPPSVPQEYPRGGQLPPHLSNQQNMFLQERNLMQGISYGQRQPSISGLGMPPPAPDVSVGSNRLDALQRLVGIENGANLKQMQNYGINRQGMYNHELDMSSPYR